MEKIAKQNTLMKKAARLNHIIIENEEHSNEDLKSIEILNSQINGGCYSNVDFSNSDMFSTKLFSVTFIDVAYKYSDINSIWASDCIFTNVIFDGSTLTDSTFINCRLLNCSFSHIGMSNNQFINCEIRDYAAEHCTITLNEFISCKLSNFKICSTFYYQIFDRCIFEKIEFDMKLLGFNYGLLPALNSVDEVIITKLKTDFLREGLLLNAAIVEINFNEQSLNMAMIACLLTISKMLSNDMIIKSDELMFVMKLFENLYPKQLIAPICLIQCWKIIYDLQQIKLSNSAYVKALDNVSKLKNFLYISYQNFLSDLSISIDLSHNDAIELEMHYDVKPKLELIKIMQMIISQCSLSIPKPVFLRESTGSFLEWIKTNAAIVPYIQAFISLLGVTVSILKKDKQKSIQAKPGLGKKNPDKNDKTMQGIQIANTQVIVPIIVPGGKHKTEEIVSQIVKITLENNIATAPDYLGYNRSNVINITVSYTA